MTTVSGTSSVGYSLVMTDVANTSIYLEIEADNTSTSAPKRVGYWYLFKVYTPTPREYSIVDSGAIARPGLWRKIPVVRYTTSEKLSLGIYWNFSGIVWTATLTT